MPDGHVVADTGPLIAFSLVGRLDLLRDLYTSVLVPEAVWSEVTSGAPDRPGVVEIPGCPWLVRTAIAGSVDSLLRAELGPGEAEAITLAVERGGARLLLDERQARRVAEIVYGLSIRGTVGTVVLAKRRGLIPAVRPLLERMRAGGYFLASALIESACATVDEVDR